MTAGPETHQGRSPVRSWDRAEIDVLIQFKNERDSHQALTRVRNDAGGTARREHPGSRVLPVSSALGYLGVRVPSSP